MQKVMVKSAYPQIQRIHWENADHTIRASFVTGIMGSPGYEVTISHPRSLEEALKVAVRSGGRETRTL